MDPEAILTHEIPAVLSADLAEVRERYVGDRVAARFIHPDFDRGPTRLDQSLFSYLHQLGRVVRFQARRAVADHEGRPSYDEALAVNLADGLTQEESRLNIREQEINRTPWENRIVQRFHRHPLGRLLGFGATAAVLSAASLVDVLPWGPVTGVALGVSAAVSLEGLLNISQRAWLNAFGRYGQGIDINGLEETNRALGYLIEERLQTGQKVPSVVETALLERRRQSLTGRFFYQLQGVYGVLHPDYLAPRIREAMNNAGDNLQQQKLQALRFARHSAFWRFLAASALAANVVMATDHFVIHGQNREYFGSDQYYGEQLGNLEVSSENGDIQASIARAVVNISDFDPTNPEHIQRLQDYREGHELEYARIVHAADSWIRRHSPDSQYLDSDHQELVRHGQAYVVPEDLDSFVRAIKDRKDIRLFLYYR